MKRSNRSGAVPRRRLPSSGRLTRPWPRARRSPRWRGRWGVSEVTLQRWRARASGARVRPPARGAPSRGEPICRWGRCPPARGPCARACASCATWSGGRSRSPSRRRRIPTSPGRVRRSAASRMRSFSRSLKRRRTGRDGSSGWVAGSFGMMVGNPGRPDCLERWGVSHHNWHGGPWVLFNSFSGKNPIKRICLPRAAIGAARRRMS
jgi:hypothetical protein